MVLDGPVVLPWGWDGVGYGGCAVDARGFNNDGDGRFAELHQVSLRNKIDITNAKTPIKQQNPLTRSSHLPVPAANLARPPAPAGRAGVGDAEVVGFLKYTEMLGLLAGTTWLVMSTSSSPSSLAVPAPA